MKNGDQEFSVERGRNLLDSCAVEEDLLGNSVSEEGSEEGVLSGSSVGSLADFIVPDGAVSGAEDLSSSVSDSSGECVYDSFAEELSKADLPFEYDRRSRRAVLGLKKEDIFRDFRRARALFLQRSSMADEEDLAVNGDLSDGDFGGFGGWEDEARSWQNVLDAELGPVKTRCDSGLERSLGEMRDMEDRMEDWGDFSPEWNQLYDEPGFVVTDYEDHGIGGPWSDSNEFSPGLGFGEMDPFLEADYNFGEMMREAVDQGPVYSDDEKAMERSFEKHLLANICDLDPNGLKGCTCTTPLPSDISSGSDNGTLTDVLKWSEVEHQGYSKFCYGNGRRIVPSDYQECRLKSRSVENRENLVPTRKRWKMRKDRCMRKMRQMKAPSSSDSDDVCRSVLGKRRWNGECAKGKKGVKKTGGAVVQKTRGKALKEPDEFEEYVSMRNTSTSDSEVIDLVSD